MEKKLQKMYLTYCKVSSIIFLKGFIKLNLNADTTIKNVKPAELNRSTLTAFLNT